MGPIPLLSPYCSAPGGGVDAAPLRAEDKAERHADSGRSPFNAIHYLGGWSSIHFYRDWYFVYPFLWDIPRICHCGMTTSHKYYFDGKIRWRQVASMPDMNHGAASNWAASSHSHASRRMEVWQGPSLSQPRTEDYGSFTVLGVASFQFVPKSSKFALNTRKSPAPWCEQNGPQLTTELACSHLKN